MNFVLLNITLSLFLEGTIEGGQGNPDGYVPAAMQDLMVDFTKNYYEHFIPAH